MTNITPPSAPSSLGASFYGTKGDAALAASAFDARLGANNAARAEILESIAQDGGDDVKSLLEKIGGVQKALDLIEDLKNISTETGAAAMQGKLVELLKKHISFSPEELKQLDQPDGFSAKLMGPMKDLVSAQDINSMRDTLNGLKDQFKSRRRYRQA